jgi:hypothetical protein
MNPGAKMVEDVSKELRATYQILAEDVEAVRALGQADPSQFAVRALIRTYFAFIEGLAHQMRQVAIACAEQDGKLLKSADVGALKEVRYILTDKGEPKEKPDFQKFLPGLLLSIRCFARIHGGDFQADTSDRGWKAMREFVELRNRLVHPKSSAALRIEEPDVEIAMTAAVWFKNTFIHLCEECAKASDRWTGGPT